MGFRIGYNVFSWGARSIAKAVLILLLASCPCEARKEVVCFGAYSVDNFDKFDQAVVKLHFDAVQRSLEETKDALKTAQMQFISFLAEANFRCGKTLTIDELIQYMNNNRDYLPINAEAMDGMLGFLNKTRGLDIRNLRDDLPGELSPQNITGFFEIAAGVAIGILSGWTGGGAALAGMLMGDGFGRVTSDYLDYNYPKTNPHHNNQYPRPK